MRTYNIALTIGPKITTVLLNSTDKGAYNSHCVTDTMNIVYLMLDLVIRILDREEEL